MSVAVVFTDLRTYIGELIRQENILSLLSLSQASAHS